MIGAIKEAPKVILNRVFYIHYLVQFYNNKGTIWALINSGSKVNAMTPASVKKLGIQIWRTKIRA